MAADTGTGVLVRVDSGSPIFYLEAGSPAWTRSKKDVFLSRQELVVEARVPVTNIYATYSKHDGALRHERRKQNDKRDPRHNRVVTIPEGAVFNTLNGSNVLGFVPNVEADGIPCQLTIHAGGRVSFRSYTRQS